VITGRGPGAPGVTSGVEFARGRVAAGNPGDGAVDLSEIRRSEEIIDVLAERVAMPARMLRDPAVTLLSALAADVDAREAGPGVLAGTRPGPARRRPSAAAGRPSAAGRPVRAPAPRIGAWARVAAAGAVAAGAASTTSFVAAGMLARLARGPASDGSRGSAPGWGATVRPRRTR
jgi:hypothetical protein